MDELAPSYAARFGSVPGRLVYCEHGNQFDPANTIRDYEDPLDTPFGDHIVTDVVRRISPVGRVGRNLDLRDIGMVYPVVGIPEWVAGRVFYDLLGRVAAYLVLPLLVGYALYGVVAYLVAVSPGVDSSGGRRPTPGSLHPVDNSDPYVYAHAYCECVLLLTQMP